MHAYWPRNSYLCLLKFVNLTTTTFAQAAGLIGCFRFLEGFYLLLVTQRRYHGTVCGKIALQAVFLRVLSKQGVQQNGDIVGQKVYGIDKTLLVPLVQPSVDIVQGQVSSCSCPIDVTNIGLVPFQKAMFLHLDLHHLLCQGRETAAEKRYRKLLLSGLELNKDFYFSYTYNLARTLQANLTVEAPADPFDSMFVWNEYLSRY